MKTDELLQLQMEVDALKQQVNQAFDTILARIEQHLPLYENEARIKRLENYDWSKWDPYDFLKPKGRGKKKKGKKR